MTLDPRAFALHKLWMSERADRTRSSVRGTEPRPAWWRRSVTGTVRLPFDEHELQALPRHLRELASGLPQPAAPDGDDPADPVW